MINHDNHPGHSGLPVNGRVAYTNHRDETKGKLEKRQKKILKNFVPVLKHLLEPEEEILLAAQSVSPFTVLEQMTTGWSMIYVVKRCILVFTDRRIIHIPATWNNKPRNIVSQIRFGDIETALVKGRSLKLAYKNGRKEKFSQIRNAKKLRTVLDMIDMRRQTPTAFRERHHLCPRCTFPLKEKVYACSRCRLEFRKPERARLVSILIPGGGYFYARRPFLGVSDFLVETYLLFMTVLYLYIYMASNDGVEKSGGIILAGVFGIILILEKLVTIYHAQHYIREFIPVEKEFSRVPVQPGY